MRLFLDLDHKLNQSSTSVLFSSPATVMGKSLTTRCLECYLLMKAKVLDDKYSRREMAHVSDLI